MMTKDELVDEVKDELMNMVKALAYHQRDRLKQHKLEQEIKLLDGYLELHNDTN